MITFAEWWKRTPLMDALPSEKSVAERFFKVGTKDMRETVAKLCDKTPCPGQIVTSWSYEESDPCKCHKILAQKIRAIEVK